MEWSIVRKYFGCLSTFSAENNQSEKTNIVLPCSYSADSKLHIYNFEEIKTATKNFSHDSFISEDKFGKNYAGAVHGTVRVLFKVFNLGVINQVSEQEWLEDVTYFGHLRHRHLVTLIGYCCKDKHRILVYDDADLMCPLGPNLYHDSVPLAWTNKLKIARGVAKGLAGLLGTDKPSISIDCINTSNILIDMKCKSKIMHFKHSMDGRGGTLKTDTEGENLVTDVLFRYGVILLEILTGLPSKISDQNRSNSRENLIEWHGRKLKSPQDIIDVMDKKLESQYSKASARLAASLAYNCLGQDRRERHTMDSVLEDMKLLKEYDSVLSGDNYTHSGHHGGIKTQKIRRK
ncbi:serine/threonine-protein kinase RIPK-like [Papaver somniferum]|uniref:serine/threonine-protein kinase RIPK-like n=1 Tax=Papaver somniferum TaxID=3469 RepID=UPI000E6FA29E|nr:serine/threonine-protein kinase RIPK-like [Papaver somniferum]